MPLLLPIVLIASLVVVAFRFDAWPVLLGVAPVGLIGYRVIRYLLKQFRNRLRVYNDRIELDFMGEDQAVVYWTDLTRVGVATNKRRRSIFLYQADEDQLVEFSDEFELFDVILETIRTRTNFEELNLRGHHNVTDLLRAEEKDKAGAAAAVNFPSATDH